jgi:predicted PurR-regulated permease PerM
MNYGSLDKSTQIILKVIFAGLALAFLWVIRDILIILLLAIVLASAMDPMVDYLHKKRIPRAVSVLAVYILVLGSVGLIISWVIPPVIGEFKVLQGNLPDLISQLQAKFPSLSSLIGSTSPSDVVGQLFKLGGDQSVITRTVGIFNGFFTVITVLVISFYLVAADKGMKEFIRSLVPKKQQPFVMNLVEQIQRKMGLWVLGQIILSLAIFLLTFVGLSILGVKYALFLALIAGLFEVLPYLGPVLSAVPAILVALIQDPPLAGAVIILYIVIQKTEGYVLVPKIMQRTIGTSPLVVLLSLLIGFKLAGVLGLLLAVPLVGAIMVVIQEFTGTPALNEEV